MTTDVSSESIRTDARNWISENFPKSLTGVAFTYETASQLIEHPDFDTWRQRLALKGWGAATWPKEYGGAGLSQKESRIVNQELQAFGAFNPIPIMAGMGVTMVGPTILEYGTEAQKLRHLPPTAAGDVRWCLGLSEPNAGSDLASLATKAVVDGDNFVLNGSKIWTSGADKSHWCGALVRTDPEAPKRLGLSFVLLPMDQEGVSTRPIKLISGASPFCETFFDNALAERKEILGPLNEGWTVIKRLLQHERASQTGDNSPSGEEPRQIHEIAMQYVGLNSEGKLDDPDLRSRIAQNLIDEKAHNLTIARIAAESKGQVKVSAAASILKNSATTVAQNRAELKLEILGSQGLGWDGDAYTDEEKHSTRSWLFGKAISIYGGSFEVQNNIISKNILGLPETTQQG